MKASQNNQDHRHQEPGENRQAGSVWKKAAKYLPFVIFIVTAFLVARHFSAESLKEILVKYDRFGFLICLIAYLLLSVTPIPSDPVTLLALEWKGPMAAIALATIGNTLSSMLEFHIGGRIGDLTEFEKQRGKLPFHLDRLPMNSPLFLILVRMLPGYGAKFVSIAAGVAQVPWFTNLWTALVTNWIGAVFVVLGGYGLIQLFRVSN